VYKNFQSSNLVIE